MYKDKLGPESSWLSRRSIVFYLTVLAMILASCSSRDREDVLRQAAAAQQDPPREVLPVDLIEADCVGPLGAGNFSENDFENPQTSYIMAVGNPGGGLVRMDDLDELQSARGADLFRCSVSGAQGEDDERTALAAMSIELGQ